MLERNDSLPLFFDTINGNTALGLYLDNDTSPSVFYLEDSSDKSLRKIDSFMEEIGHIPIESKLVIESVETIMKNKNTQEQQSTLETFLERCKKRAISDRKNI